MAKLNDIINGVKNTVGGVANTIGNFFSPQVTAPAPVAPPKYVIKDRGINVTDDDFQKARPVIFGEISNRNRNKKMLEANVILNTALNRVKAYADKGTPKTLAEVLAMPNQYQAYGSKQYNEYSAPSNVVSSAKKQEVDSIMDEIYNQIKAGTYNDTTGGAVFYQHKPNGEIRYNQKSLFAKK